MKKVLLLVALFVFITPRALIAQGDNAITYNRVIFTPPAHTTPEVFIVGASVDYAESTLTGLVEYTAHYTSFERTVEVVFSLVNKKGETIAQKTLQKVLRGNTHGFWQIAIPSKEEPHDVFFTITITDDEQGEYPAAPTFLTVKSLKLYNNKVL